MLNRVRLLEEMQRHGAEFLVDHTDELLCAKNLWNMLSHHPHLAEVVSALKNEPCVPHWRGSLGDVVALSSTIKHYQVLSVDGSQVYPDRHQGDGWYLINTGSVLLSYQSSQSSMVRDAIPSVLKTLHHEHEDTIIDHVNCKRSEYELLESLRLSKEHMSKDDIPRVCLIDGSLIFWHLDSKPAEIRSRYLVSYLTILQQFYEQMIPVVGYISLPKSKELIHLMLIAAQQLQRDEYLQEALFAHLVDADLMDSVLSVSTRSTLFEHRSSIVDHYPAALKPWFCYLKSEHEIARLEFPAWLTRQPALLEQSIAIIMDQVSKGRGYPVVLAEAHETAVIKSADREFFFRLLEQLALKHNKRFTASQKSLKKRSMYI